MLSQSPRRRPSTEIRQRPTRSLLYDRNSATTHKNSVAIYGLPLYLISRRCTSLAASILLCLGLMSQTALAQTASTFTGSWNTFSYTTNGMAFIGAKYVCEDTDIDNDNDGLIELCYLEDLNAVRHALDGSFYQFSATATTSTEGCASSGCNGYELVRDLDFDADDSYRSSAMNRMNWTTGTGWSPIGDHVNEFSSIFDGNGYTLSNLKINKPIRNNVGLFGVTIGDGDRTAVIKDVGLLGVVVHGGTRNFVGSLVGQNKGGMISNGYSTGQISGDIRVGGRIGGLVGSNGGTISNSYSTAQVSGYIRVGGLVGGNEGMISNSYSTSRVSGHVNIGGLVGGNSGTISNSYSSGPTGRVSGAGNVGGLVGSNTGVISNSYSTKRVQATDSSAFAGGLVGLRAENGTATYSYWDTETSETTKSVGGVGKTTTELQSPTTATGIYAAWDSGWDFGLPNEYPAITDRDGRLLPGQRTGIRLTGNSGIVEVNNELYWIKRDGSVVSYRQIGGSNVLSDATTNTHKLKLTIPKSLVIEGESTRLVFERKLTDGSTEHLVLTVKPGGRGAIDLSSSLPIRRLASRILTAPPVPLIEDPDSTTDNLGRIDHYQWQRFDIPNWVAVGSNTQTYTISGETSSGTQFRVQITYTDGQGYAATVSSAPVTYRITNITSTWGEFSYTTNDMTFVGARYVCSDDDTDIDNDDDGLIELCYLEDLDAIRYQLQGIGLKRSSGDSLHRRGCGGSRCNGYELVRDLDFRADDSYRTTANKVKWATTATAGWLPIGGIFRGIFAGNSYTLSNLSIARTTSNDIGLFSTVSESGSINDLCLLNVVVHGNDYVGGLAGNNDGSIINSYSTGRVSGSNYVGGLAGNNGRLINNSYSTGQVSGVEYVGGLVGYNYSSEIINSYSTGTVKATGSDASVGGLVGYNDSGKLSNSYSAGQVEATGDSAFAGGLVGQNVGSEASITNSYSTGKVTANGDSASVGGLVGHNDSGKISNSYSLVQIEATGVSALVGGLVGDGSGQTTRSYWDITESQLNDSAGGEAKTTVQLQSPTTATGIYAAWTSGWDFGFPDQYPAVTNTDNGRLLAGQRTNARVNSTPTIAITRATIQTTEGETVTIDASGTMDRNGDALTYRWHQVSGDSVNVLTEVDTNTNTLKFNTPRTFVAATTDQVVLRFSLTVSDAQSSATQQVAVTVSKRNDGDITLTTPTQVLSSRALTAEFDWTADPDSTAESRGSLIDYQWLSGDGTVVSSGTSVAAAIATTYTVPAAIAESAAYRLQVRYTDGQGYATIVTSAPVIYRLVNSTPTIAIAQATIQTAEGETVTIDASDTTDQDGDALTYRWRQVSGDGVNVLTEVDTNANTLRFDIPRTFVAATTDQVVLRFSLTVSDAQSSATQQVAVTVSKRNDGDITLTTPTQVLSSRALTAEFDWTADPDSTAESRGSLIDYQWLSGDGTVVSSGTSVAAAIATTYTVPAVVADNAAYRLQVRYTDGQGYAATVTSAPVIYRLVNSTPTIAITRATIQTTEGETVTIDASGTMDRNGDALTYRWHQVSGDSVNVLTEVDTNTNTLKFNTPRTFVAATTDQVVLRFSLTVSDAQSSATQQVAVTVSKRNDGDITLTTPTQVLSSRALTAEFDWTADPDSTAESRGSLIDYQWLSGDGTVVSSGTSVAAAIATTYTVPAAIAESAAYRLQVRYTDGQGYATIVTSAPVIYRLVNSTPTIAIAQATIQTAEGETVTIDASDTTDQDGDALTYRWRQVSGDGVNVLTEVDTNANTLRFDIPRTFVAATTDQVVLRFSLTVSDAQSSATQQVAVTVSKRNDGDITLTTPTQVLSSRALTAEFDWTADPDSTAESRGSLIDYQWLSGDGTVVSSGTSVAAAIATTYTVPAAIAESAAYRLQVRYTDGQGYTTTVTSLPIMYRFVGVKPSGIRVRIKVFLEGALQ